MYFENELNKSWKWILGMVSAMLLLPQLAMKELTTSEAEFGLMSRNAFDSGKIFSTIAQGQLIEAGHLFPWLINFFGLFGVNEFTIRLPSILGLTIMIFTAAYVTYQYGSRQSAIVAGTCMLSTVAAVKMGTRGEEKLLASAFISLAWMVWFHYSRSQKQWFKAWFFSLALTSLAVYCSGYYNFLIFYLPLFFLRRPTDIRKRIFHLPHFKAVGVIVILHFIVYLLAVNITASQGQSVSLGLNMSIQDYESENFINFPFTALYLLLPWTFFSWPAYCTAFEAMEKDHILFHFLRTVTVSLFIVCWLLPGNSPLDLLPILVPISIMTGLHYQILVRRHHIPIRKLIRFTLGLILVVNLGWLIFFGLTLNGSVDIQISNQWIYINSGIALLAILLSVFMLLKGKEYPVWLKIICMVVLGHWSIITFNSLPFEGAVSQKVIGRSLSYQIPKENIVYNMTGQQNSKIMFYADRKIIFVTEELTDEESKLPQEVYVIGSLNRPVSLTNNPAHYKWAPVSPPIAGEHKTFQAWKGVFQNQ